MQTQLGLSAYIACSEVFAVHCVDSCAGSLAQGEHLLLNTSSEQEERCERRLTDLSLQGPDLMKLLHPNRQSWRLRLIQQLKQATPKLRCCDQKTREMAGVEGPAATP